MSYSALNEKLINNMQVDSKGQICFGGVNTAK